MPARQPASALLLIGVGAVFLGGLAFGAVAALTGKRPATARTDPAPDAPPEPPAAPTPPAKPEPKKEEPKKPEPKKEEPKKPDAKKPEAKPEPKKPDPPKPEPKKPETVSLTYEKDILPVFKSKCLLCHGNPKKDGGLDLRTLKAVLEGGDGGAGVVAGKPADSPVWIRTDDGSMPKNPKDRLTKAEMKLLADWIAGGAK